MFIVRCSLFVVRVSSLVTRGSSLVVRESDGMGEVAGEDAIGGVWGEGFIFEAAWRARALALRFGRVASQRTTPTANITPIARPILKSFCISPAQKINGRKRALIPFPPGS